MSNKPNMLMIYLRSIICLTANLPHLPTSQTKDYHFIMVILYLIHMAIEAWLELCTISPSPDLTSPLQFIKFVNICQHPQPHILLQLKEYFIILEELLIMALNSLLVHYHCLLTHMQIGLVTQVIVGPLQNFASI